MCEDTKTYNLKPCPTCGCEIRYLSNGKCFDCCLRLAAKQCESVKKKRRKVRELKEKTPRQKAAEAGYPTYIGRLCKCGGRVKYVSNGNCLSCAKASKPKKKKPKKVEPIKPKLRLSNMAWC